MSDPKPRSKTEVIAALADRTSLEKKDVTKLFEVLGDLIQEDLKDGGPGSFTVPGLMKIKVVRKPATPERRGVNPFTKEETVFKAKPAQNVVKINALKGLKDLV